MENETNEKKKSLLVIIIVLTCIVALVGFTVYTFVFNNPEDNNANDEVPTEEEVKTDVVAFGTHIENETNYITAFKKDGSNENIYKCVDNCSVDYNGGKYAVIADITNSNNTTVYLVNIQDLKTKKIGDFKEFESVSNNKVIAYDNGTIYYLINETHQDYDNSLIIKIDTNTNKYEELFSQKDVILDLGISYYNGKIYYIVSPTDEYIGYVYDVASKESTRMKDLYYIDDYYIKNSSIYVDKYDELDEIHNYYIYDLNGNLKKEITKEEYDSNSSKEDENAFYKYKDEIISLDTDNDSVLIGDKELKLIGPYSGELLPGDFLIIDKGTKLLRYFIADYDTNPPLLEKCEIVDLDNKTINMYNAGQHELCKQGEYHSFEINDYYKDVIIVK